MAVELPPLLYFCCVLFCYVHMYCRLYLERAFFNSEIFEYTKININVS